MKKISFILIFLITSIFYISGDELKEYHSDLVHFLKQVITVKNL